MPKRPSEGTTDPVWQFLEECWSWDPSERPSTTRVYNTLSKFRVIEELPAKLELQVQSIKFSLIRPKKQQFFVKFKYGDKGHTTSLATRAAAGDEYTWFAFCSSPLLLSPLSLIQGPSGNLVDRNRQAATRAVGIPRSATMTFKRDKVCATGYFSVSPPPL